MKKDFVQLVKDMRITFRPEFKSIASNTALNSDQFDEALHQLEEKRNQMILDNGYTPKEFDDLSREYFMDFSSENPDEWVIRHEPSDPQ